MTFFHRCSNTQFRTTSSGIYSWISDKYCNCHTCICFFLSRIDYCTLLLLISSHNVTPRLQLIQNYAAPLILRIPISANVTKHITSLASYQDIYYEMPCLCYHCHNTTTPSYVTDLLPKKPSLSCISRFSSHTMLLNRPPQSKAILGDCSFFSSSAWNSIPNDVWCAPSFSLRNSRLKTYFFHLVCKDSTFHFNNCAYVHGFFKFSSFVCSSYIMQYHA